MIDHINEKCSYVNSATIISVDGISAQMYGLWLKAKHSGSLLFMNSLAEEVANVVSFLNYNIIKISFLKKV